MSFVGTLNRVGGENVRNFQPGAISPRRREVVMDAEHRAEFNARTAVFIAVSSPRSLSMECGLDERRGAIFRT